MSRNHYNEDEDTDVATEIGLHPKELGFTGKPLRADKPKRKERLVPETDDEKATRIALRMSLCMHIGYIFELTSEGRSQKNYRCGYYREGCPYCLASRAKSMEERVRKAHNEQPMNYLYVGNEEVADAAIDGLNKSQYYRVPMENGTYMIFLSSETGIGESVTTEYLDNVDWNAAALTPVGMRVSGRLGAGAVSVATPKEINDTTVRIQTGWFLSEQLSGQDKEIAIDMAGLIRVNETLAMIESSKNGTLTQDDLQKYIFDHCNLIKEHMEAMSKELNKLVIMPIQRDVDLICIAFPGAIHTKSDQYKDWLTTEYNSRVAEAKKLRLEARKQENTDE
jgi:hypothetical protein